MHAQKEQSQAASGGWGSIPDKGPLLAMLATGLLLMVANMSIEPIITVYVAELVTDDQQGDAGSRCRDVGRGAGQHPLRFTASASSPTASDTGP